MAAACKQMRREALSCPKPRRLHCLVEALDSDSVLEYVDGLLTKDEDEQSPPFFSGSPPSRVTNPVVRDPRFREHELQHTFLNPQIPPSFSPVSPLATMQRGFTGARFGLMPATVRIEGFDSFDQDPRRRRAQAVA